MARIRLPEGDEPEVIRGLSYRPLMRDAVMAFEHAVANSQLSGRIHELVRMRVAQINRCPI